MISSALDTPIMVEKTEGEDENDDVAYIILDGKNGIPFASIRGTRGMTWDTSLTNIDRFVCWHKKIVKRREFKQFISQKLTI